MSKVLVLASSTAFLLSLSTSLYLSQLSAFLHLDFGVYVNKKIRPSFPSLSFGKKRKFYLCFPSISTLTKHLRKSFHFQLIFPSIPFSIQTHQVSFIPSIIQLYTSMLLEDRGLSLTIQFNQK